MSETHLAPARRWWRLSGGGWVIAGIIGVIVLVAAPLSYLWLSEQPVRSQFGAEILLDRINHRLSPNRIEVGTAEVQWHPAQRELELSLSQVELHNELAETFIVVESVQTRSSLPQLLRGNFLPAQVEINAPHLHVVRPLAGGVALQALDGHGQLPIAGILATVAGGGEARTRTAVRDSSGQLTVEATGQTWVWRVGRVHSEDLDAGGATTVTALLEDSIAQFHSVAVHVTWNDAGEITINYEEIPVNLLSAMLLGTESPLPQVPMTVVGQLTTKITANQQWSDVSGTVTAEPGTVPLAAIGDVAVGPTSMDFRYSTSARRLELIDMHTTVHGQSVAGDVQVALNDAGTIETVHGRVKVQAGDGGWQVGARIATAATAQLDYVAARREMSVSDIVVQAEIADDGKREDLRFGGETRMEFGAAGEIVGIVSNVVLPPTTVHVEAIGDVQVEHAELSAVHSAVDGTIQLTNLQLNSDVAQLQGRATLHHSPRQLWFAESIAGSLHIDQLMLTETSPWGQPFSLSDYGTDFIYHPAAGWLDLSNARVRMGTVDAEVQAGLQITTAGIGSTDLQIGLPEVTPNQLRELWPPWLSPNSRDWFFENVPTGLINASITVQGPMALLQPEVQMEFTDLDIRYLPTMPPISAATGHGRITQEQLVATLTTGVIELGGKTVDVHDSSVILSAIDSDRPEAEIQLSIRGGAAEVVRLAEFEPVRLAQRSGVRLRPTHGYAVLQGKLVFPLLQHVTFAEVQHDVSVSLDHIAMAPSWLGLEVRDGYGTVSIRDGELATTGVFRSAIADVVFDLRTEAEPSLAEGSIHYVMDGAMTLAEPYQRDSVQVVGGPAQFLLHLTTNPKRATDFDAEIDLTDLNLDLGMVGRKPAGVSGLFSARGTLTEGGVRGNHVNLRLPGLQAEGQVQSTAVGLSLALTGGLAVNHVPLLARYLEPDAFVEASLQLNPVTAEHAEVVAELDLEPLRVTVPRTGIVKVPGKRGHLRVVGDLRSGTMLPRTAALELGPIQAAGTLQFSDDGQFKSANLNEIRFGPNSRMAAKVTRQATVATHISLFGDVLDLQEIRELSDPTASADTGDTDLEPWQSPVVFDLQLRRLHFAPDIWIEDVSGRIQAQSSTDISGEVVGRAFGKLNANLTVRPTDSGLIQVLQIDNAGEALNALGYTSTISGGQLQISRTFTTGAVDANQRRVSINDVAVRDAPLLAQLLTFVSGVGLVEYIFAGNTSFSTIEMTVEEDGDLLRFTDGVAEGASIGFIFVGDLHRESGALEIHGYATPVRFLTRLIGGIPVLGRLVEGSNRESSLGVGFVVTGTIDDPETTVQPLSLLIPFLPRLQNLETSSGTGVETTEPESPTDEAPLGN